MLLNTKFNNSLSLINFYIITMLNKKQASSKQSIIDKNKRKFFIDSVEVAKMPDLTEIQQNSYNWFINEGLKELFDEISPVTDFIGRNLELHFKKYYLDNAKFTESESREKNITYEAPLRILVELKNKRDESKIEQEVYLGEFPLMTKNGTFIINGIERAIVSQLIRSAGVIFTATYNKGIKCYGAKIIPNRGTWLEIETDVNRVLWVRIDRKRKVAVTSLLRAFGYGDDEEIKNIFKDVDILSKEDEDDGKLSYIDATIKKDAATNEAEGLQEVYKKIRPGDFAATDNAKQLIYSMFFRFDRYDFGGVGRYKLNRRFGLDLPPTKENRILRRDDLINIIKEIIRLNITKEPEDDIDHLGNRRVRAIGELIQNKFRVGLARMQRIIKDRMSTAEFNNLTPNKLINAKPVISIVKEFFMSSQLSQFMDQTNPLAELEHKRRLSAMGPGGLTRERAGFEVRDVHPTHFGRICPIETPEGPNIGLIGHLACYARLNKYGFLQTPYREVLHDLNINDDRLLGKVIREDIVEVKKIPENMERNRIILSKNKTGVLLSSIPNNAKGKVIVKANTKITKDIIDKIKKGVNEKVLIPIIPIVTDNIIILDASEEEKYTTTAFTTPIDKNGRFLVDTTEGRKFGQPTTIPVEKIDFIGVAANQIISVATSLIPFMEHDDGQRALMGSNMQRQAVPLIITESPVVGTGIERKAAYDSGHLIIAEDDGIVSKVEATSISIENKNKTSKYSVSKFVKSNSSTCMNQHPVVNIGDKVKKGDILSDGACIDDGELALGRNVLAAFMSWEGYNFEDAIIISDRLVKDDVFSSIHIEDYSIDVRDTKIGPEEITNDIPNISEEKLKNLDEDGIVHIGAEVSSGDILVGKITPKGETELTAEERLLRAIFGDKSKDVRDSSLYLEHGEHGKIIDVKIFSRKNGDKLPVGVIKKIQITIANVRKIQVGDKMAGRHGNKGVVSKIVPINDMPFLEDGTPIDIILSPLGVVSRMNLGQVLETHLGFAATKLGYKAATPVLNGITEEQIEGELEKAGLPKDGKVVLYDGKTGNLYDNKVVVGYKYMLKLDHMIEDKVHQRAIGPYSLITQQPLGGKAQFGGQRFGEMEVWALEGYGAAHTLQEVLTIKSDDVSGRGSAYESIIKGGKIEKQNVPESFNVLVREMKGLGLNVELLNTKNEKK